MGVRMMRGTSNEGLDIIQPTVGYEGEFLAIKCLRVQNNQFVPSHTVSTMFSTRKGVSCVDDHLVVSPDFFSMLEEIADEKGISVPPGIEKYGATHIFEFVTLPKKTTNDINIQFKEIAQLETDLIKYLLKQKKEGVSLIRVSDWIEDYNLRFPDSLSGTAFSNEMYIFVDYSLSQLKLTGSQLEDLRNSSESELDSLSSDAQAKSMHNVQFNFVSALGKKMGSMLVEIFEANNKILIAKETIRSKQKNIDAGIDDLIKLGLTESQALARLKQDEKNIESCKKFIATTEKQREILLSAEQCAERACNFIRDTTENEGDDSRVNRKLIKLEGFFFILSMRILTETANFNLPSSTTSKNKYLFLLKTQLSDLVHSLSSNDKLLLESISKWSDDRKNKLLAMIAGSYETLATRYQVNGKDFSVKEIIESAFGWSNPGLCNEFPGAATKSIEPPLEPSHPSLRGKEHEFPIWRILFEYRGSVEKNLNDSHEEMEKMLDNAALFCKTTYMNKEDWKKVKIETVLDYLGSEVKSREEKVSFISELKLYNSELFDEFKKEHSDLEAQYQSKIEEKKLNSSSENISVTIHCGMFNSSERSDLLPIAEFKKEMLKTLSENSTKNKLTEYKKLQGPAHLNTYKQLLKNSKIASMIKSSPELISKTELYQLLLNINTELNNPPSMLSLRTALNPPLLKTLKMLSTDEANLEVAFTNAPVKSPGIKTLR